MNVKRLNEKGFSLVELIVVIAVLAVITVVAAPQYLNYVEITKPTTLREKIKETLKSSEEKYR